MIGLNISWYLQYTPPRTGVFKPIRTDGTFERWPKKIAIQSSIWRNPYRDFWPRKTISPVQRRNPYKDFFLEKSISPILGQSLEAPQHRAHIHVNFKNSKSSHTTTQSPHLGELWKLKVLTRHNTEPTHRGTLKAQSPHTPQHRVYTHGNLKTQSPHTPQHRAHTNGNFENSKSSHATAQSPHRGTLKTPSPHTPKHRDHTLGNFVENLKVSTHHSTMPTHMGALKLKVFTHHSMEPTARGTLKTQSPHTPQHRAHTQGNFEKSQSLYTPQHSAHTQGFLRTRRMTVPSNYGCENASPWGGGLL